MTPILQPVDSIQVSWGNPQGVGYRPDHQKFARMFSQPAARRGTLIPVSKKTQNLKGAARLWPAAALLLAAASHAQQPFALLAAADHLAVPSIPAASIPAAQLPSAPSATVRPLQLTGGVQVLREQPGAISLTLDDAIAAGLKGNTQIALNKQQELFVHGQILSVGNALLPNLQASAYTQRQVINLAAMGFKRETLANIDIPGFDASTFSTIVTVNTTNAQLSLSQQLFNVPAYYLYRAAEKAAEAANWNTLNARGGVALSVGGLYLRSLADAAQIRNAEALLKQDELVYEHAKASRDAGVGVNLDVIRAQVQLQNEQQQLIQAQNAEAKDKIQLNREMGMPAGQELTLVDTVPFAQFDAMALEDALRVAYERRKDLRSLEAQLEVADKTAKAVKFERLPTIAMGGFYGVLGETTGLYHGVFAAQGQLVVPIFQEAELRGQREIAQAQVTALHHQIDADKSTIEGQIRSSMLDVQSSAELVKVSHSNVDLATQALSDATMRFTAGVDDNLPVVRAQTDLQAAQAKVIQSEFQYNYAKLTLARNTGVVETEYKRYLGK